MKQKIEHLRAELHDKERQECVFRPYLQAKKKTESLIQRKPYNDAGVDDDEGNPNMCPGRFGGLYDDAKKRQERQAKLAEAILDNNCTFKPDTSATKSKNDVLIQKNGVNLNGEAR